MKFRGKTIAVTAAGQGIGHEVVLALARDGAQVWASDIRPAGLEALTGIQGVRTSVLDVTNRFAVDEQFSALGELHGLFNCAGIVHSGTILSTQENDWDTAFNVNARSQFLTMRAALPLMLRSGGGSIVNMASVVSSVKGLPNRFVYGASKAAVVGMTKSVAADFVAQGIRCNAVAPGTVDTPSLRERIASSGDFPSAYAGFVARQPVGRLATAQEVASLVVYLLSDDAAFITGQNYSIDGGMTI